MSGILYLVPTPIGNLKDMTFRAVEVLKSVDLILAEDTRTSAKLCQHYDIGTPMKSHHMHNEHSRVQGVVDQLISGQSVAVISDAGTPAISDPGFLLVREAIGQGIQVDCLPGATAFVPALVSSGLPCERFLFEGFLPVKKGRQTRLNELSQETRTMVFYESPHKLLKTLQDFCTVFGSDRPMSVSRELSKLHQETLRGSAAQLLEHFQNQAPRGEFVLVLSGMDKKSMKAKITQSGAND
ncbi:MAG: 16S rRNA (cytidine(1402)-2'-O)-methyltransferase [Flavobacteriaceae bacterium]